MITTFVVRSKNSYETVEGDFGLFNTTEEKYGVNFYKHIMEQYKLFVELR